MAKKKITTELGTNSLDGALTDLERQRAERVLVSQGRAIGMLDCFPVPMQRAIAEFCDGPSGAIQAGTREAFAELLANFFAEQKADVDEQSFHGFGKESGESSVPS